MKVPVQVSPEELVSHLTKVADTTRDRLRVLVRWIGDNIEYDVEKLRNAYERREALIKAGMWAGASVDYWGVDETTPLGGWCV